MECIKRVSITSTQYRTRLLSIRFIYGVVLLISLFGYSCISPGNNNNVCVKTQELSVPHNNASAAKECLYEQLNEWKSVPYRYGGLSKKGIDCSGFVYLTYLTKFGITLPRNTKLLSEIGREISQRHLKAGDLVFFKTGLRKKHVGIYIEKRKFIHVTTSKGVIISSLEDPYWLKRYWKSIAVIP